MTTSRRAWLFRAAASLTLTGATLAVPAAPVAAAPPAIRIESVSSDRVTSGASVRVRFQATNNNQRTEKVFVAVSGGLRCTAGCSAAPDIAPGRSKTFNATVVAPEVDPSQESGYNLAVSVRIGTQTAFDHQMILVRGTKQPSSAVRQISGRVRDAGGKTIGGATVSVRDSAGHDYQTVSDRSGRFSIRSSDSKPIAAGRVTVVAAKDGYRTARTTVPGGAGSLRLTLTAVAARATTSPPPTATASLPAAAEEAAPAESLAAAAPPAITRTADEGSAPPVFTMLGGLLVAAGAGVLVLMLLRRRKSVALSGGVADAPTMVLRTVPPDGRRAG